MLVDLVLKRRSEEAILMDLNYYTDIRTHIHRHVHKHNISVCSFMRFCVVTHVLYVTLLPSGARARQGQQRAIGVVQFSQVAIFHALIIDYRLDQNPAITFRLFLPINGCRLAFWGVFGMKS